MAITGRGVSGRSSGAKRRRERDRWKGAKRVKAGEREEGERAMQARQLARTRGYDISFLRVPLLLRAPTFLRSMRASRSTARCRSSTVGRFTYKFNKHISYLMHAQSRECFDRPEPPFSSSDNDSCSLFRPSPLCLLSLHRLAASRGQCISGQSRSLVRVSYTAETLRATGRVNENENEIGQKTVASIPFYDRTDPLPDLTRRDEKRSGSRKPDSANLPIRDPSRAR